MRSNAVSQVKKAKEGHSEDILRLIEKQVHGLIKLNTFHIWLLNQLDDIILISYILLPL